MDMSFLVGNWKMTGNNEIATMLGQLWGNVIMW